MSGHTPGPWHYRPYQHDDWGTVRGSQEIHGHLPVVANVRSGGYPTEQDIEEHRRSRTDPYEANARLIAAAPDLLEALKEAQRYLAYLAGETDNMFIGGGMPKDALALARAAIAKATGGEA